MSAADDVAQLQVVGTQAVSAAVVAEAAATETVLVAETLIAQVTQNAAEQVADVVAAVDENKDKITWLTNKLTMLEAVLAEMRTTQMNSTEQLVTLLSQVLESRAPQIASPQSDPVVDLPVVVESVPVAPVAGKEAKKRHKLL